MRFIVRNYADKPRKLRLATTTSALQTIALTGDTSLIKESIYRDPYPQANGASSRVIEKLNRWYLFKCAYCERIYKLDVEHYRPKAQVRDENNVVVQVTNPAGLLIDHPGYYWLCYEWTNLIPSCPSCNREGGKHCKFPNIHHYEYEPCYNPHPNLDYDACLAHNNPLISEQPYLLHPEIDDPTPIFTFEIAHKNKGIDIKGVDALNRGLITIDICICITV